MKVLLNFFLTGICCAFFSTIAQSQNPEKCATADNFRAQLANYPDVALKLQNEENQYRQYVQSQRKISRALVTIPVVVHVVHNGDAVGADENITDEQILSQIDVLNEDFRKLNSDTVSTPAVFKPLAADFEIEFCLAARDPDNNPTTGIERINGRKPSWNRDSMEVFKPTTIWDPSKYLNIWVAKLGGTDASTLGYAQFPFMGDAQTDGVVIDYKAFGRTGNVDPTSNLGRTTTHEVGHWLGLYHIWGDDHLDNNGNMLPANDPATCSGDDLVADTPNQSIPNYHCTTFPHVSCGNGPNGDMYSNYMDYTPDACSNLFTLGQKSRADFYLLHQRASVAASDKCELFALDIAMLQLVFPTEEVCTDSVVPVILVKNNGAHTITKMLINYQVDNVGLSQEEWTGVLPFSGSKYIYLPTLNLPTGQHSFYVYLSGPNGGMDENQGNEEAYIDFEITATGAGNTIPAAQSFEGATFVPDQWEADNPDNDRTWERTTLIGSDGIASAVFDNFNGTTVNNPRGKRDGLITPAFDLRNNSNIPLLTFDVSYAQRTASSKDSLIVYYSVDCGSHWTRIWAKGADSLATVPEQSSAFIPSNNDWRREIAWLEPLAGQHKVQFKFENYSDWGNNLYLDNIQLKLTPVGMEEKEESNNFSFELYPNPNDGEFYIRLYDREELNTIKEIVVYNLLGKEVFRRSLGNSTINNAMIKLPFVGSGVYLVELKSGTKREISRIMLR